MAIENSPELENRLRELQALLEELGPINEKVRASEKVLEEKRGLYLHYSEDYNQFALKHNKLINGLVEMRSRIQENQMQLLNVILEGVFDDE